MNDIQKKRDLFSHKIMESTDINLLTEVIKTNLETMEGYLDDYLSPDDFWLLERINHELVNKRDKLQSERTVEREAINK